MVISLIKRSMGFESMGVVWVGDWVGIEEAGVTLEDEWVEIDSMPGAGVKGA
jgi:hypothetical protein